MAKENDTVSPEEKLLRVIQGEGESAQTCATSGPTATLPPVVRPIVNTPVAVAAPRSSKPAVSAKSESAQAPKKVAPATIVRPKLKSAAMASGSEPDTGKAMSVKNRVAPTPLSPVPEEDETTDSGMSFAETGVASRKQDAGRSGLGVASRLLALAAVVLLLLSAWEIRGAYQQVDLPASQPFEPGQDLDLQAIPARLPLPDLDQTLSRWRHRPLLVQPTAPGPTRPDDATPRPPPKADWELYIRNNLKLLGLSRVDEADGGLEALVSDTKTGRMHYVRTGSHLLIETRKLEVTTIEKDRIVLTDGDKKIPLR